MDIDSAEMLGEILRNSDKQIADELERILSPSFRVIVDGFYEVMMTKSVSRTFLDHDTVQNRLKSSLEDWLTQLFKHKKPADIDVFIERQKVIGDRHARINIPFSVMQMGINELKKEIFRVLVTSDIARGQLAQAIVMANEYLDCSTSVMNQYYISDMVKDAREQQSLKLHSMGLELAVQTETLRASLFDWHRSVLRLLFQKNAEKKNIPNITKTSFGLWVIHKGELLFPDTKEILKLRKVVESISSKFDQALKTKSDDKRDEMLEMLDMIDDEVTKATEILSTITDRTIILESGKDPLTKLFNRRYLRTVLQKEVKISSATNERFGIIIVDIDYFKRINDQYGHEVGDGALKFTAELLLSSVRAGDFVFRYGGEEFLIVLTSISGENLITVMDKLVNLFRQSKFKLNEDTEFNLTISAGGALHDGHPDYAHTISKADEALYDAKNRGRNQFIVVDEAPS